MSLAAGLILDQTVIGLLMGMIYALLAGGMALIFGQARLVNFAHGSLCMAGAYAGWLLSVPLGLPLWLALPGSFALGAVLGLGMEAFLVRPLSGKPGQGPLLVTLGLAMMLDSLGELLFSPDPRAFGQGLPEFRLVIGGVNLGFMDLLVFLVCLVTGLGLFLFLGFTPAGRAFRASAQDPEAARQMGVRTWRMQGLAFGISSGLAGLAGFLVGLYYNQISPSMGFPLMMKGLSASVLGGLASVPAAMAGGLVLGLGESYGVGIFGSSSRNMIMYLFLVLALLLRPQGLFGSRRIRETEAMTGTYLAPGKGIVIPRAAWPILALAAIAIPLAIHDPYLLQILTSAWITSLFCLSLTFLTGSAGVLSLGHAGLMALGAYASGLLTLKAGLPFPLAFVASGLVTALLGTLIALPALRLRGHYIAVATLAMGEIINQAILLADPLTQGVMGLAGIPPPSLFGLEIVSAEGYYWLALGVLILGFLAFRRFMKSGLGLVLRGLREDGHAAASLGMGAWGYRGLAFGLSAFFAGLAGALTAHLYTYISPETFPSSQSMTGLTMAITGGLGNLGGTLAAALGLSALPEALRFVQEGRWLLYGVLLILILRLRPQGLAGGEGR